MRDWLQIDRESNGLSRRYPGIREMPVQDEEHRRVFDALKPMSRIDWGVRYDPCSEIFANGVRLVTMSRVMAGPHG
jgi:hypothetical protein